MKLPRLYPIVDSGALAARGISVAACTQAFLEGGAQIVQLRHKGAWTRDWHVRATRVAALCRDAAVPLIIDDRADMALLLGAGLHGGQDDLAPADARRVIGPGAILGFSSHNPEQLRAAAQEPVDYLALGPVFGTRSKDNPDPVVGVQQLRECRLLSVLPLVAIGGITKENALTVLDAGADSVAVIAGLLPETCTTTAIRQRMEEWQRLLKAQTRIS